VNFNDLSVLLAHYGSTSGMGWSQGDFTYDGTVNFNDLSKLLANYGGTGPLNINNLPALALDSLEADSQALRLLGKDGITLSQPVPEPSSIVLCLFGVASLVVVRRRFLLGIPFASKVN
jgi:hypothetical protein